MVSGVGDFQWEKMRVREAILVLLGRKLINSSDNDDEGLLGSPAMVARPLDFRTIDLRLATGAYGGSHEAFLEDVREVCLPKLQIA